MAIHTDERANQPATTAGSYRTGITAADVLAAPGALTTSIQAGGSLVDTSTYNNKVVAGNTYGRTTATAGTARTAAAPNQTLRIAIPQPSVLADYYDIYVSTDADPKWVGRITEAQRASGIIITAVGVTGAGGVPGAVDVQVPGTGLQAATVAAQNTAYTPATPTVIDPRGCQWLHLDINMSRTGDGVAPSLEIIPFYQGLNSTFFADIAPLAVSFGGASNSFGALRQSVLIEVRGRALVILVAAIAGTGASVDLSYSLS